MTIEALYANMFQIYDLVALAKLEYHRAGFYTRGYFFPDLSPSQMFRKVSHYYRHGTNESVFLGGAMLTRASSPRHVIGIISVHEGKVPKALIADTGPKVGGRAVIRKVPFSWLDRHAARETLDEEPTAVAFVGRPYTDFYEYSNFDNIMNETILPDYYFTLAYRDKLIQRLK